MATKATSKDFEDTMRIARGMEAQARIYRKRKEINAERASERERVLDVVCKVLKEDKSLSTQKVNGLMGKIRKAL